MTLRNRVSPWKSFLFELNEKDGFFSIYLSLFFLRLYRRVVWRLQKVSSFFHCSDTRVHFCFIFLISTTCFFFFKCNLLIKKKDKHWPFDLSSPLFLLTEATSWTLHPFRQVNRQSSLVSQQYCGKIPFRNMRHLYRIHIKKTLKKRLSLYEGKRNLLVFTKWLKSELMYVSRQTQLVYLYMGKSRYIVFLDRSRNTKPISSQLNSIL